MANDNKITYKTYTNHIYEVYIGAFSNNNLHHLAIYNEKRDSTVLITLDNTGYQMFKNVRDCSELINVE